MQLLLEGNDIHCLFNVLSRFSQLLQLEISNDLMYFLNTGTTSLLLPYGERFGGMYYGECSEILTVVCLLNYIVF